MRCAVGELGIRHEIRVAVNEPLHHILAKPNRQLVHFVGLTWRRGSGALVLAKVSLSPNAVERIDEASVGGDRQPKRLYGPFMGALSLRTIAFRGQRKGGQLKRSIVRDAETPIGAQPVKRCVLEVSINDREQVGDFLGTRVVLREPPVFQPALQCHLRCRRA